MAEVATKKINVVSNKKSEVCGVQSNNCLIDLDNLTSNNQLISLCDNNDDEDDLILTNNTRNELDSDDKSLQELIENELALRICANAEEEAVMDAEESTSQPETIRTIVLDRRQDDVDVNTEFIVAEAERCSVIKESYGYQNGHVSPETKKSDFSYEETVKPEPVSIGFRDEKEQQVYDKQQDFDDVIITEETTDEISRSKLDSADNGIIFQQNVDKREQCPSNSDPRLTEDSERSPEVPETTHETVSEAEESSVTTPAPCDGKYEKEEVVESETVQEDIRTAKENDSQTQGDTWAEQVTSPDSYQAGQFSDNFDQQSLEINDEAVEESSLIESNKKEDVVEPIMAECGKEEETEDAKELSIDDETKVIVNDSCSVEEKMPEDPEEPFVPVKPVEEPEEETPDTTSLQSRSFDDAIFCQSAATDAETTQEFIDMERRVLNEETVEHVPEDLQEQETVSSEKSDPQRNSIEEDEEGQSKDEDVKDNDDDQNLIAESSSEKSVSEPTFIEKTEIVVSDSNVTIVSETRCLEIGSESFEDQPEKQETPRAPLATPDDETSDASNMCDSESREETITTTTVVNTSSTKGTKTKKKKIEGVAGNDASPNLTPRTKKTKKSKKSELEKENISVKSSFNKFDALSKKTVLHVRSIDAGKVQQQLNAVGQNGDTNPNCRSCGKVVFQMEQTKAEGLVWHKNCFRCVQCSKQLNVDNYESHESTLYCKPHFKELFQPKPVEESDQPASDKPDLGLEELSSLNVKSRFQVFEKAGAETNEIERSPSQIAVKRSPSILSKLAKFQAKGMDIGVADESLNGIPYEESSESEEEEDTEETEEVESEIVKAKRKTRERPISFTKMDDIKNRWETTSQQGRREVQREARKEEIAGIRSRLFMGKQGKMKEMYQQAVAGSERVTKINAAEEIQHSTHARSIKERFERGEPIAASDDETDSKPKPEKADEEVIAAGISRKSRSLFLELDASAAKTGRPVTPVNPKTPAEAPRRARDMDSPEREIYRDPDVVRAEDRVDEVVHTDTARKMLSIFRQMEENATKKDLPNGPKPLKRFTPPPEDKFAKPTASDSEEEEEEEGEESEGEDSAEERDPNYVRASDKVEDEFLKQAQNAARAKTLCAKFEHWEETDGKTTTSSGQHIAEMEIAQNTGGDQLSIESASSLRARFESLGSQTNESPRTTKVKVNRFVEIQASCTDVCESCEKKVYPLEKVETNNKIFHKQCFRCLQCNCVLRMDTFTLNNGKLYCIPHFKQLFITRGNYDEGFGVDPHKNKWSTTSSNPTSPSPIAVSNGDL